MNKKQLYVCGLFFSLSYASGSFAGAHLMAATDRDPKGSDIHMAYENDTFTPGKVNKHLPGAALSYPGDSYRLTLSRNDEYANNPNYEIVKAIAGVHIDDYDWNKKTGDSALEWGKILINGKALTTTKTFPWDKRPAESSQLVEMMSDAEISKSPNKLLPAYIFDVTELTRNNNWLTFEIVNTKKNGSTLMDGISTAKNPYGNFVVNRVGYHVWYKKKVK